MAKIELTGSDVQFDEDGTLIRRTVLPAGVRVLSATVPHSRSVSVGIGVGAGSGDEVEGTFGATHFLEHLLFKGTANRTAQQIAEETDYLGGEFNAATAKNQTFYYGHVFADDLAPALDLLADMVTSARLDPADMETERGVILQELAMYADDATDVAQDALYSAVFGDHPLGRPVGGTPQTVSALERDALAAHFSAHYRPQEIVVVASGAVEHEALRELVAATLSSHGWNMNLSAPPDARRRFAPISYSSGIERRIDKPVEQSAVLLGMPAMPSDDPCRHTLSVLSMILGGGTSSRLFQAVREERGLAYATYAFPALFPEGGLFALYAATASESADEVSALMRGTLEGMADSGVTNEEVNSAIRRVRASLVFASEHASYQMNRLAAAELVAGYVESQDAVLDAVRAVTPDDVKSLAADLVRAPLSTVIVGGK
ncbi:MAG: pitrilysin family protein [Actinomycetaceae bacterium]|nr:pitrilysin family protein [Actinomycetaceae bacterium]MDY6083001.1 pitrilysin family protein [Actinomycetaceae bacterium]